MEIEPSNSKMSFIDKDNIKNSFTFEIPSNKEDVLTIKDLKNQILKEKKAEITFQDYFGSDVNDEKTLSYYKCLLPFYITEFKIYPKGTKVDLHFCTYL